MNKIFSSSGQWIENSPDFQAEDELYPLESTTPIPKMIVRVVFRLQYIAPDNHMSR